MKADVFYQWSIAHLMPALPQHSGVVMDNATFHKRKDMQKAYTDAGHTLAYLPPYAPDLNSIAHRWAQLKKLRQKLRCSIQHLISIVIILNKISYT
jgi:transposase